MGCYAHIINSFQPLTAKPSESQINIDKIDMFFTKMADIYVSILENGYESVEYGSVEFENNYTKEFFIAGMTGLKQAVIPMTLEIILEFLSAQASREQSVSASDLFEICLLKKIMPILRMEGDCIRKFIDFLIEFCSGETQHFQIAKFIKFIEMYKVTECYYILAEQTECSNNS